MKFILLIMLIALLLASGCTGNVTSLKLDIANSGTEVFIYLTDQGYALVRPELLWSQPVGRAPVLQFVGVSPEEDVYLAPQDFVIYRIENGKAVKSQEIDSSGWGGAWGFSFITDGTLYFADGSGSVGKICQVIDGKIGYDTIYYQRQFRGAEPFEYIRGFGFDPQGVLYFNDECGIYKVENGSESIVYGKTLAEKTEPSDCYPGVNSVAIGKDSTIYFIRNVYFTSSGGGWCGYGPAGVIYKLTESGERAICAAINQDARSMAVGVSDSIYVSAWRSRASGDNEMRLWKVANGQKIVQTNAKTLQFHDFRMNRTGYIGYTVTNGTVSEFRGNSNAISCIISGEPATTIEMIIGLPKESVEHPSRMSAEVAGAKLNGQLIESEAMYYVVISFSKTQERETVNLKW